MPVKSSGSSLNFSEIAAEFGKTSGNSISLGAYRVSANIGSLTGLPLDDGIPGTGAIKVSDFYSKKLNIVVDLHSIADYSTRLTARVRYNDGNVDVIGGFRAKPASSAGCKVRINVNKIIGSSKDGVDYVALRTGGWEPNTELSMDIGSGGVITGAGGNGGNGIEGPSGAGAGNNGGVGSSGLGVEYPTTIRNKGYIQSGVGGGGGGAGATGRGRCSRTQSGCEQCSFPNVGGGGGAGGRGYPAGDGGGAGGGEGGAGAGASGSLYANGISGGGGGTVFGGECNNCTQYATGGTGGGAGTNGNASASCYSSSSSVGSGAANGNAIMYSTEQGGANIGSSVNNSDGGSVDGSIVVAFFQ